MIKKIILLIALFFLPIFAFAQESPQIELSLSMDEVATSEAFDLSIHFRNIEQSTLNKMNISLPGADDLEIVSKSQSTQTQIINNQTSSESIITLTMLATKEGNYELGPISLDYPVDGITTSNIVKVKVLKDDLLLPTINNADKKPSSFFNEKTEHEKQERIKTQVRKSKINYKKWILNILALVLLGAMTYKLYKQKKLDTKTIDTQKSKKGNDRDQAIKKIEKIKRRALEKIDKQKQGEKEKNQKVDNIKEVITPNLEDADFFTKSKTALIAIVQNRSGLNLENLTNQEIAKKLEQEKIDNIPEIKKALHLCEQGKFSFSKNGKEELLDIINKLNNK